MRKVLVTGAEGLVGSAVCRRLCAEGMEVLALYRTAYSNSVLDGLPVQRVQGDVTDEDRMYELMSGTDAVVHAAADIRIQGATMEQLNRTNVEGTKCVANACQRARVGRLVFISSASIFLHGPEGREGNESRSSEHASFELPYARSKRLATEWLLAAHAASGLPVLILAPTFVIGPYDRKPGSGRLMLSLYRRRIVGYSSGGKNFVHVDSVADAVFQGLDKGRLGQAYIVGGENMRYRRFFESCYREWGRPFRLPRIPDWVVRSAGEMGALWTAGTGRHGGMDRGISYYATIDQYYDHSKALNELGYANRPIQEAISDSTRWFRENGYL